MTYKKNQSSDLSNKYSGEATGLPRNLEIVSISPAESRPSAGIRITYKSDDETIITHDLARPYENMVHLTLMEALKGETQHPQAGWAENEIRGILGAADKRGKEAAGYE